MIRRGGARRRSGLPKEHTLRGLLMSDSVSRLRALITDAIRHRTLRQAVLSRPRAASEPLRRTDVRPVELKSGHRLQFTGSSDTQQFHANLNSEAAEAEFLRLISEMYSNLRMVTDAGIWSARFTRRGKCFLTFEAHSPGTPESGRKSERGDRRAAACAADRCAGDTPRQSGEVSDSHNRDRRYLIPEGVPCPFLIQTGVMSADGRVRAAHYHKFRQINRYLEFIRDAMNHLPTSGEIRIVDSGCGNSYLTFATHYLITCVIGRECRITGLDRRADVIATCRAIVDRLGLQGIDFQQSDIAAHEPEGPVHLAISLHACDTATDDALNQAVRWGSDVILAVPCCHQELAAAMSTADLKPITDHGILRDRFAALATDAQRAAVLKWHGYDTRVMEFIELEHTARNLLIRAVRRRQALPPQRTAAVQAQLAEFRQLLGSGPLRLETLLTELPQSNICDRAESETETGPESLSVAAVPGAKDVRINS